jgi:DNA-binding transcriptional LysR family regulator
MDAQLDTNVSQLGKAPGRTAAGYVSEKSSRISLKQWRLFQAVVDHDGFLGAAKTLHVSQSAISHALAKLQDELGVQLLTIKGRKACLTDEGEVFLRCSRELVRQALELEELGENLRLGRQLEVRLAVEPHFPTDLLLRAFHDMVTMSSKTRLSVEEVPHAKVKQSLYENKVDLAISTELITGFSGSKLIEIEQLAVAHADNPLFRMNRELTFDDLRTQTRIALHASEDSAGTGPGHPYAHNPCRWKMDSLDSAAKALSFANGYAWLPRYRVQEWLDGGIMRVLPLNSGSSFLTKMYLIQGRSANFNAGAKKFADALQLASQARTGLHEGSVHTQDSASAND